MRTNAEATARAMVSAGIDAVLVLGGVPTVQRVQVRDWRFDGTSAAGVAVFGPYASTVEADGVEVFVFDGSDVYPFESRLRLPAGVDYRHTVRVEVS